MPRIFVSYSRVDQRDARQLVKLLRQVYRPGNVWMDDELHGGEIWWETILDQIAACDVFIYLLSDRSVGSPYCRAEYTEAYRLRKAILPVLIRDRTEIPADLSRIQYVDLTGGPDDSDALTRLYASIRRLEENRPRLRPRARWAGRTPLPDVPSVAEEASRPLEQVNFPPVALPPSPPTPKDTPNHRRWWLGGAVMLALALVAALIALSGVLSGDNKTTNTPTAPMVAQGGPTATPQPSATPSASETPRPTATFTATLDPVTQVWVEFTQTAEAAAAFATATAARWTYTPSNTPTVTPTPTNTPNYTATMDFWHTAAAMTLTALWWTDTPTPTRTPTRTPTPTPTRTLSLWERALTPVARNAAWRPIGKNIGGMEMVFVPAGCFQMGSEDGDTDERPVHRQCFAEPFWIGRYEVTNAQYQQCVDAGACDPPKSGYNDEFYKDDHPAIGVSWFNARQYVQWLSETTGEDFRLPTEAEWEYAARGPDGLAYPWGNEFVADNVVYSVNSGGHTQPVGSKPGGASWVGALNMSGNVREWTNTVYRDYPYSATDGRESVSGEGASRVVRGGSWGNTQDDARAAYRNGSIPLSRNSYVGFRVVRPPSQ